MKIISKILEGQEVSKDGLSEDMNEDDVTYFKYAPITSVEVGKSFFVFKTLFSDNRRTFLFENIMHTLVVQYVELYVSTSRAEIVWTGGIGNHVLQSRKNPFYYTRTINVIITRSLKLLL